MLNKYLVFSDLHADLSSMYSVEVVLKQILDHVVKYKINNVIFTGDMFEMKKFIHIPVFNRVHELLYNISKVCDLHIIAGNHDYSTVNQYTSIDTFKSFANVYRDNYSIVNVNGWNFYFVPFNIDEDTMVKNFIECRNKAEIDDNKKILFFHTVYDGFDLRYKTKITKEDIGFDRYTYCFGGHIHKNTEIDINSFFVGSCFQCDFSEVKQDKGFYVFDDNFNIEYIRTYGYTRFLEIRNIEDYENYKSNNLILGSNVKLYTQNEYILNNVKQNAKTYKMALTKSKLLKKKSNKKNKKISLDRSVLLYIAKNTETKGEFNRRVKQYKDQYRQNKKLNKSFNLNKIEANNVFSYRSMSLDFKSMKPGEPIGIFGYNNDNGGSNGSGKSSILETIYYGLFGVILRGVLKDDIIKDDINKDCSVFMDFSVNNQDYKINRYRKDTVNENKFFLFEGDDAHKGDGILLQSYLDNILDKKNFAYISFLKQNKKIETFSLLTPGERRDIIYRIIGFDWVQPIYDDIKLKINSYKNELLVLKNKFDNYKHNIFDNHKIYNLKKNEHSEFLKEKNKATVKNDELIKEAKRLRLLYYNKISDIEEVLIDLNKKLEVKKLEIKKCETEILSLNNDYRLKINNFSHDIKSIDLMIKKLESSNTNYVPGQINKCDKCYSEYNSDSVIDHNNKEIERLILEKIELQKKCKVLDDERFIKEQLFKEQLIYVENKFKIINNEYISGNESLSKLNIDLIRSGDIVNELSAKSKYNDIDNMIESINRDITMYKDKIVSDKSKIDDVNKKIDEVEILISDNEFWLKAHDKNGFKNILFTSLIPYIEDKINEYLLDMGIMCEFKAKGNNIEIAIKSENTMVDYQRYSGGERAVMDVAIILALNEIARFLSISSNVLFIDETFEKIDGEGQYYKIIYDMLKKFSLNNGCLVYVITHNNSFNNMFSRTITIEKSNNESRISSVNV